MMDFKSKLKQEAEKVILKKAAGKILPMDEAPKPKLGKKAKLAALLGAIATLAAAGAQYLGG
jgi:hypothetical protein